MNPKLQKLFRRFMDEINTAKLVHHVDSGFFEIRFTDGSSQEISSTCFNFFIKHFWDCPDNFSGPKKPLP